MRKETCLRIIVFFCAKDFWFRMYIINQRNTTLTYLALNKVHSWCLSIDEVFLKHARTWESTNATPETTNSIFLLILEVLGKGLANCYRFLCQTYIDPD